MKDSYFYLPGHRENLGSIEIERGVPENSMILIDEDDTGESFYADWVIRDKQRANMHCKRIKLCCLASYDKLILFRKTNKLS